MGDAKTSVINSLFRGLIFIVSGMLLLSILFGKSGNWIVNPLTELFTLIYCWWIIRKKVSSLYGVVYTNSLRICTSNPLQTAKLSAFLAKNWTIYSRLR